MATITTGHNAPTGFTSGEVVTATKLNAHVNSATVTDIVNADIKSDAAIAGTKLSPNFGSQNVITSGLGNFRAPSDHWAPTSGFFAVGGTPLGQLDSHGSFEVTLTSNGYRDNTAGTNLWVSHGANSLSGAAQVGLNPNGVIVFRTESGKTTGSNLAITERMRITSDGTVFIGKTSSALTTAGIEIFPEGAQYLTRDGGQIMYFNRLSNDGTIVDFRRNNTIRGSISISGSTTAYNTTSDYRLKQNVEPMVGGLAKLAQLKPSTFEFKEQPNIKVDGFLAHEVQAVVPQAVTGEKDGEEMQGLDMSKLVPVLVAAVQELSAKVVALEAAQ